jgi:hypothetical protein
MMAWKQPPIDHDGSIKRLIFNLNPALVIADQSATQAEQAAL